MITRVRHDRAVLQSGLQLHLMKIVTVSDNAMVLRHGRGRSKGKDTGIRGRPSREDLPRRGSEAGQPRWSKGEPVAYIVDGAGSVDGGWGAAKYAVGQPCRGVCRRHEQCRP